MEERDTAFRRRIPDYLPYPNRIPELTELSTYSSSLPINSEHDPSQYVVDPYDSSEPIPSYETSQYLHEQQGRESEHVIGGMNTSSNSRASSITIGSHQRLVSTDESGTNTPVPGSQHRDSDGKRSLRRMGLKFLNAKQHFLLACCRDLSLVPCLIGLFQSWSRLYFEDDVVGDQQFEKSITSARSSEHFLTGVWCIVSSYLSYSVLDGLMVRWIVTYSTTAAILRMLSMSTILITIEQYLVSTFTADGHRYGLHIWILISCCLTITYIGQSFVTSNIDAKGKKRARFFNYYNISVFAVVPVGLASFITMIGLLRSLLILRLDIDQNRSLYPNI